MGIIKINSLYLICISILCLACHSHFEQPLKGYSSRVIHDSKMIRYADEVYDTGNNNYCNIYSLLNIKDVYRKADIPTTIPVASFYRDSSLINMLYISKEDSMLYQAFPSGARVESLGPVNMYYDAPFQIYYDDIHNIFQLAFPTQDSTFEGPVVSFYIYAFDGTAWIHRSTISTNVRWPIATLLWAYSVYSGQVYVISGDIFTVSSSNKGVRLSKHFENAGLVRTFSVNEAEQVAVMLTQRLKKFMCFPAKLENSVVRICIEPEKR